MNRVEKIEEYLEELYPDAHCELNYSKDYELLLAVMLSAQTTDKRVNKVTKVLFKKYDTLEKLSKANIKDLEDIIKEIGTYHKKAVFLKEIVKTLTKDYNSVMPRDRKTLEKLPGVGRKTVNVVLGELGLEPTIAVDTHVNRVSKRLKLAKDTDSVLEVEKKLKRKIKRENWVKRHHQLIFFGRYHCKAVKPECKNCKLKNKLFIYRKNSRYRKHLYSSRMFRSRIFNLYT